MKSSVNPTLLRVNPSQTKSRDSGGSDILRDAEVGGYEISRTPRSSNITIDQASSA